jgi:hypothetical protein
MAPGRRGGGGCWADVRRPACLQTFRRKGPGAPAAAQRAVVQMLMWQPEQETAEEEAFKQSVIRGGGAGAGEPDGRSKRRHHYDRGISQRRQMMVCPANSAPHPGTPAGFVPRPSPCRREYERLRRQRAAEELFNANIKPRAAPGGQAAAGRRGSR